MASVKTKRGDLPVNYGHFALAQFSDDRDISMDEVYNLDLAKMSYMDIMTFLYIGLKDGARKNGVDCAVKNVEDFCDMIDDDQDVVGEIFTVFSNYRKGKADKEASDKKK